MNTLHILQFLAITNNPVSQAMGIVATVGSVLAAAGLVANSSRIAGQVFGFVNNRTKGLHGRLGSARTNAWQKNKANMHAGTRFNNGALNTLTARATTRHLGFGRQGRAAYKNKMELKAEEFAQSPQGKVTRWEDDINRAATYSSEAQARASMVRDWNIRSRLGAGASAAEHEANIRGQVDDAVSGVKASGGFGEPRRIQALQALTASKTGFDNIEQAYGAVARVAGGNEILRNSLAGAVHAGSAANGRHDLAPGAVRAMQLAEQVANGGGAGVDWHGATMEALEGVDMVSFLRDKPTQTVQYVTQSLAQQLDSAARTMNTPGIAPAVQEGAQRRFVQASGIMEQIDLAKTYAPPISQNHVNAMMNDTSVVRNRGLDNVLGRTYDASGERTDLLRYTLGSPGVSTAMVGQIVRDNTGTPMPSGSVTQEQIDMRRLYEQSRTPRPNANDPNMQ